MENYGAGEILLTSMDRDGTKVGYDLELTCAISDRVGIPVIASGGVGNLEHIYQGFTEGHASAALAASIFHYQRILHRRLQEISERTWHSSADLARSAFQQFKPFKPFQPFRRAR